MDPFASYAHVESPQHFWAELDDILDTPFHPPSTSTSTDPLGPLLDAKRSYVASVLAKFLHLCAACFNDNLSSEYNQEYCINRLFSSTAFRDDADSAEQAAGQLPMHQLAAEQVIRTMQTSTSIPMLLMTYEIVLQYGEAFPATYKSIQTFASTVSFAGLRAFLHRLVHQIWAGSYAAQAEARLGIPHPHAPVGWTGADWTLQPPLEPSPASGSTSTRPVTRPPVGPASSSSSSSSSPSSSTSKDIAIQISLREKAVRMLYEVCRVQKLESAHLKAFDERFIHHLFDLVEETRHHHDENFNYRLIKLLVAMNEQYMVTSLSSTSAASASNADGQINSAPPKDARPLNLVLGVLQQRLNASKTFGENLIFMLNRASSSDAEDVCMQLLVLKLLYLLFTTKETACYFYTNDLRVLVDIFVRELSDLPDESESLRHTYLRVLHPLLTNTQLCTYAYKRPQIRRLLLALVSHAHLRDISSTTRRLVERCLRAEWCVELDRLDGTSSVAVVQPIGGGETHDKKMQGGITTEGLPMLSTKIKADSANVRATTQSIAITTQDTVASPISLGLSTDSPTILESPVEPSASSDLSGPSSRATATGGSLSVPSTLRTRDKRVLSLSHPRSASGGSAVSDGADVVLRPNSAAAVRGGPSDRNRRAVSAQSAPCTPPRIGSPAVGSLPQNQHQRPSSSGHPQYSLASGSDSYSPVDGGDMDDALSSSSSWHAHMAEDHPLDHRKSSARPTNGRSVSRAGSEEDGTNRYAQHLQHVNPDLCGYPPRIGSPLSNESTSQVVGSDEDFHHRIASARAASSSSSWGQVADDAMLEHSRNPSLVSADQTLHSHQHGQDASDSTITDGGLPKVAAAAAAAAAHDAAAPKRRKPPQPPSQSRRAMQISSSEPHFGSPPAGGSPPSSALGSIVAVATNSRPESPHLATATMPVNSSSSSTTGAAGSGGGGGAAAGRRRPPPPPPTPASSSGFTAGPATGRQVSSGAPPEHSPGATAAADQDNGITSPLQPLPPPPPTTTTTTTDANAAGTDEIYMSEDQSFYVAERLRRGLRIR
ncbi:hypothetical protein BCV70DRAFT_197642 [Testicularia cyperi]|uniref:SPIN90/Ldb17 leucine-rich domain-containing protein n=1 Tax=Testicularia cyperi TaxID=1882483 RepID=A0A317XZ76_9BASI|nr:hypothetical protein BCV70DRAFT_197642 [Testicularia cyperi]